MGVGHLGDDLARGYVEGGIEITDTVALVLSRLTQGNPWHHRTYGLGAIKGLYLGLLINTEDDGRLWRVQVDPSNVLTFSVNSGSFDTVKLSTM